MNISPSGVISPHRGLRVFMLLLAWVVGASFSWADLLDLHAAVGGAPVDLPQATELDLDEIRDDTATNCSSRRDSPKVFQSGGLRFLRYVSALSMTRCCRLARSSPNSLAIDRTGP